MITFTIAKQFQQSTFVRKSKNFKMSLRVCTFRNFRKLTQDTNVFFNLSFNSHEFPMFTITVRRKKPQGTSSVIHFFNKLSIVKQLFIESGA